MSLFNPMTRRKLSRVIPFGIIWLLVGWLMLFFELAASRSFNPNPGVTVTITVPVFIFASVTIALGGLGVGFIEVFWLERFFSKKSFGRKLLYRLLVYSLFLMITVLITYPIAASIEQNTSPIDPLVFNRLITFLGSLDFFSTLLQLGFVLFLSFFYLGIVESVGDKVMVKFFTGKYHKPLVEERIFMFLDMRASTTIAEKLGNLKYFDLLKDFYDDLSESIVMHSGEVYQYVGDEVVISWNMKSGTKNDNCIQCFYAMQRSLERKRQDYLEKYDLFPEFKAGIHCGEVTTGEIGVLKKEIFYTGDVLNVTSRIQNLCNKYKMELIISEQLANLLMLYGLDKNPLGTVELKGRTAPIPIFGISRS